MRKVYALLVLFICVLTATKLGAQANVYSYAASTGASLETIVSPTTTTNTVGATADDDYTVVSPASFVFKFNNVDYTSFGMSTNGWLKFGNTSASSIPSSVTSVGSINAVFGFARDANLNIANGGDFTHGSAAGGKYVFQFTKNSGGGSGSASATIYVTFQVVLWGSTSATPGRIEIIYGTNAGTPSSNGTIGIVDASNTFVNGVNGSTSSTTTASSYPTSGTKYSFTPPANCSAPANQATALVLTPALSSIAGSFTAATSSPSGYLVVRYPSGAATTNPVGGTTYTTGQAIGLGTVVSSGATTTFTATGLALGTTYDFYVYDFTSGVCLGIPAYNTVSPLSGSQTTLPPGSITSNGTGGGNWNATSTWIGGVVPTANDNVLVKDGDVVTINATGLNCYNLTVGEGASGTLQYLAATLSALTINANLTIANGGIFTAGSGSLTTHTLTIGGTATGPANGNIINNGTLDLNTTAGVTVTLAGAADASISGSGATTDFYAITINKGTTQTGATMDVTVPITMSVVSTSANRLVITAGTFKLSSASNLTPIGGSQTVCASTGRLWLNNAGAVYNGGAAGSPTVTGELRIDAGTWNYGVGNNTLTFTSGSGVLRMSGGTLNMNGAVSFPSSAATQLIMSGGAFNVDPQVGANLLGTGTTIFSIGSSTTVDWSGGTITIIDPHNATAGTAWSASSGGSKSITGGTLSIGDGTSTSVGGATANTNGFGITSSMPVFNLVINNRTDASATRMARLIGGVVVNNNLTVNSNSYLFIGSGTTTQILTLKGSVIQNGTLAGCEPSGTQVIGTLYFNGQSGSQTLTGSGSFVNNSTISVDNANSTGVTFSNTNLYKVNRVNLFDGSISVGPNFTLGNSSALTGEVPIIQYGGNGGTLAAGTFVAFPNLDETDGPRSLFYSSATNTFTLGFNGEIGSGPQALTQLLVNNGTGVSIPASITSLNVNTTLTMTAGNINLAGNTLTLGTSTTIPGTLSYTAGLIQGGPFTRWFGTSGLPTSIANGNAGHFPLGAAGSNRNFWLAFTSATGLSTGGTITVGHSNATGLASITPFTDGGVAVDTRTNASWTVSTSGPVLGTGTILTRMQGSGLATIGTLANLRMIRANDAVGTSSNGTGTTVDPQVNRTGLDATMLANTFYMGAPAADLLAPPITWIVGSGNWSNGANWSSGSVPTATDNIQISPASAAVITLDGNYAVSSAIVSTNATLNIGSNALTINTGFTQSGGTINLNTGTLDLKGNFTRSSGTFNANTGTVSLTGSAQSVFSGTTFYDLVMSGGTKTFTTGQTYAINNNLTVNGSAVLDLSAATSTTITVNGNLIHSSATAGTNLGSLTLSLSGIGKNLTAGSGLPLPNLSIASAGIYTMQTDIEDPASRTITVNGRLNTNGYTISGAGAFTMATGSILGVAHVTGGLGSALTVTGTKTYPATSGIAGFIEYNAAADQVIDVATHPVTLGIWTGGSGTKTLTNNIALTANSNSSGALNPILKSAVGSTFADGGYTVSFANPDAGYGNVEFNGGYLSTGSGGLTYPHASNLSGSTISFVDGTAFGNINLNTTSSSGSYNLRSLPNGTTVAATIRNVNFGNTAGGLLVLNNSGITNITVTGNVNINPTTVTNTGGGFSGTSSTTGTIRVRGNISSTSTAATQPLISNTGTNTLILDGSSPQTITLAATNPTILSGATLKIDNPNGFNLGQALTIGGALNMAQGSFNTGANNLTLGAAASAIFEAPSTLNIDGAATVNLASRPVTLKSSSAATARIATIMGTLNNASNVTVERFIPSRRAWRLLSAPLTAASAPSIFAAWQEGGAASSNGTHITQAGGNGGNGFDASTVAINSSIRYFDGTALLTPANTDVTKVSDNGGAYFLFVRGNRNIDINNSASVGSTTLRMAGTINQGPVTTGVPGSVFSLIPNPYPSPVDYEAIIAANPALTGRFYVWNANGGSNGSYLTIERTGANTYQSTPSTGDANSDNLMRYILSGQAFFVPGSATVNFIEAMKTNAVPTTNTLRTGGAEEMTIDLKIVNGNSSNVADGVRAKFANNYSNSVDAADIIKNANFNENLAIVRSAQNLAVEKRDLVDQADTIFLKLWNTGVKNYEFTITPTSFNAPLLSAYLEDAYLGTSTPVSLSTTTNFSFAVTSDAASANPARFRIVFKTSGVLPVNYTSVKAYQQNSGVQVDWKIATESNMRQYEVERSADGRSFAAAGTVTARSNNNSTVSYGWFDAIPVVGTNYYRIKAIDNSGAAKYSQVVNVKIGGKSEIVVYPNPVKGNIISLQFTNEPKGSYTMKLFNNLGQLVFSKNVEHIGGSATQSINLGNVISKGIYQMEVTNGEARTNQQIIIQ